MSQSPPSAIPSAISEGLRSRMQSLGISSFRALSEQAGITRWQLRQFRAGRASQMRLNVLQQLSDALQIQLGELLAIATSEPSGSSVSAPAHPETQPQPAPTPSPSLQQESLQQESLQQEYDLLKQQLEQQRNSLQQEFQRNGLYRLETWMKNWPKVVHVVQTRNPDLPAAKILALVSPLQQLLDDWGIETIGEIGARVDYDPTVHSLSGSAEPGDPVEVTRPGYLHHGALLHRAEVQA